MEARNLEAKDANGLSDPYCQIGIMASESASLSGSAGSGEATSKQAESNAKHPSSLLDANNSESGKFSRRSMRDPPAAPSSYASSTSSSSSSSSSSSLISKFVAAK